MFTGLVREIGTLRSHGKRSGVTRLEIRAPRVASAVGVGDSVAVDGICLTVVRTDSGTFAVEAMDKTAQLTTLPSWRTGRALHLEPALRAGDALDGHFVQGHVDGTGQVISAQRRADGLAVTIGLGADLVRFLTPRGSVAVDGVSLTVDEGPFTDRFTVNLIPHTLGATRFDKLRVGDRVNLEMDVLVKAARHGGGWPTSRTGDTETPPDRPPAGLTLEKLLSKGFGRRRDGR